MESDSVTLLCENGGAPIPRHRWAFLQNEFVGQYSLREEYDRDAKRKVKMARLRGTDGDVLPPLRDANVLYQERGITVVTGLEVLDDLSRRRTAQTWYVKMAGYRPSENNLPPLFTAD